MHFKNKQFFLPTLITKQFYLTQHNLSDNLNMQELLCHGMHLILLLMVTEIKQNLLRLTFVINKVYQQGLTHELLQVT